LFLYPVLTNRFFWLPLHEFTSFDGFHLDSDVLFTNICMFANLNTCFYGFFPSNLSCRFPLKIIPCGLTSWFWLCQTIPFASFHLSLPDSYEPTCWLPLYFQPFQVFHFGSDILTMTLFQALSNNPPNLPGFFFQPVKLISSSFKTLAGFSCWF